MEKVKLGVTFNVFDDCIEHLQSAIMLIRDHVDYINLVYQLKSNRGIDAKLPEYKQMVSILYQERLANSIIEYDPDMLKFDAHNEIIKRHLGMLDLEANGCTHFITMDCDEFYNPYEFKLAKTRIINEGAESSTCNIQSFYKKGYKYKELDNYQVPFIYKIRAGITFEFGGLIKPYTCDPTRVLQNIDMNKHIHFDSSELIMNHYTYVRRDLRHKLENSSARINWTQEQIDEVCNFYDNFENTDRKIGKIAQAEGIKTIDLEKTDYSPITFTLSNTI